MPINRLKLARLERGLRQYDVAQRVGIGENLVSKIETGRTKPSLALLERIAATLGLSVEELVLEPIRAKCPKKPRK